MWVALRLVLRCGDTVLTGILEPHVASNVIDEQWPVAVITVDHITCVLGVGVHVMHPLAPQVVGLELFEGLHVRTCVAVADLCFTHDAFL